MLQLRFPLQLLKKITNSNTSIAYCTQLVNNCTRNDLLRKSNVSKRRRYHAILHGCRHQRYSECDWKGFVFLCLHVFQKRVSLWFVPNCHYLSENMYLWLTFSVILAIKIREPHRWCQYQCIAKSNPGVSCRMGTFANHFTYWLCDYGYSDGR